MKYLLFLLIGTFGLFLSSCNRQPNACIKTDTVVVPLGDAITFENCSQKGKYFEWDLGDGTQVSYGNAVSVVHTYAEEGSYRVNLCAFSRKQDKSSCTSINVEVVNVPFAEFSVDSLSCVNPCPVQFTNTSDFADEYLWEFGDGTTSTEENPSHTYTDAELYTVTLTASNAYYSAQATEQISVIDPYPPTATFTIQNVGNFVPMGIQFENLSSNGTSFDWSFGDGFYSSEVEPYHVYYGSGSFTVVLTVTNQYGEDTYTQYVSIPNAPSAVRIDEVELLNFPSTDPNGTGWDADCDNSPADVFFSIANNTQVLFNSGFFSDINSFPVWYQNSTGFPFTLTPLSNQYFISLFDQDDQTCQPNDLMIEFPFIPQNIVPVNGDPYPDSYLLSDSGFEFRLYLTWY